MRTEGGKDCKYKIPLSNILPIQIQQKCILKLSRMIWLFDRGDYQLEKMYIKIFFNFLRDHHVLTSLVSGFIFGDSTVKQLVDIYITCCKALDEGKNVHVVFYDISTTLTGFCIKVSCTKSKQFA